MSNRRCSVFSWFWPPVVHVRRSESAESINLSASYTLVRRSEKSARPRRLQDSTGTIVHATQQKILPQQLISCSQRQKCHTITALIAIVVWIIDFILVCSKDSQSVVYYLQFIYTNHAYRTISEHDDEVRWSKLLYDLLFQHRYTTSHS